MEFAKIRRRRNEQYVQGSGWGGGCGEKVRRREVVESPMGKTN